MNTLKIHPAENASLRVEPSGPPPRKDSFDEELEKIDRKQSIRDRGVAEDGPIVSSINHDNKPSLSINVHQSIDASHQ